jgi:hypothetical protein
MKSERWEVPWREKRHAVDFRPRDHLPAHQASVIYDHKICTRFVLSPADDVTQGGDFYLQSRLLATFAHSGFGGQLIKVNKPAGKGP